MALIIIYYYGEKKAISKKKISVWLSYFTRWLSR
jgi:hypothetical protein